MHPATSELITPESLLAALRKGNKQDRPLEIGLGDLKVPVRLISAAEELKIVIQATQRAQKENLVGIKLEVSVSYEVMRSILYAATTIEGQPKLASGFLELLTSKELAALYDQYTDLNDTINPNIQELSLEEILSIVEGIKKKTLSTRNLFSFQLRGVGKYFLDVIIPNLPTGKEPGSA